MTFADVVNEHFWAIWWLILIVGTNTPTIRIRRGRK